MKHIKLYEDFYNTEKIDIIRQEYLDSFNFYEPIAYDQNGNVEDDRVKDKKLVSLDDKTFSAINKLGFGRMFDFGIKYAFISKMDRNIAVWQYEDEWYKVDIVTSVYGREVYVCDQLEGLIKCLKAI